MAIKLDCPRCKSHLAVPDRMAGSYAICPSCQGRFWVEKTASADGSAVNEVTTVAGGAAPTPSVPLPHAVQPPQPPPPPPATAAPVKSARPAGSTESSGATAGGPPRIPIPTRGGKATAAAGATPAPRPAPPSTSGAAPAVPPPAPPPPPAPAQPGRKRARFISAEAARSPLRLAEDGQLPELHLEEGQKREKPEEKSTGMNPLVLFGALSLSVVFSIVLVLMPGDSGTTSNTRSKAQIRAAIEREYFGGGSLNSRDLQPYQIYLREAQIAHERGDRRAEAANYRRVLDLIWSQRGPHKKGMTGSQQDDRTLEGYINALLSRD